MLRISKDGVVHIRGNGGGQGYDCIQGVERLYGSYLTFVAHPSRPPTCSPVVLPEPVVHDTRLTTYCGPYGNDHNWGWCGQTAEWRPCQEQESAAVSRVSAQQTLLCHSGCHEQGQGCVPGPHGNDHNWDWCVTNTAVLVSE